MQDTVAKVGYARISTKEQFVINQILKLREAGITVIFYDEGISGKVPAKERPEFKRMMEYIKQNPSVEQVVVYELSRIGRTMLDTLETVLDLESKNITVISLTEPWTHQTDKSVRPLMISIISWINQQELIRLSERTKAGMERARKEGKIIGKPPKKIDRSTVDKLRAEGKSWNKIAAILNIDPVTMYRRKQKWKADDLGRSMDDKYR